MFFANRVAFKSPATISQEQATAKYNGEDGVLATRGRHDPCVVPRYVSRPAVLSIRVFSFFCETKADSILEIFRLVSAVPIVEAMAALVIME